MHVQRIVLDTSVIVSALRSTNGASAQFLRLCLAGAYLPVATPALFFEYEMVLKRPHHHFDLNTVETLLDELSDVMDPVRIEYEWRPQLPDPDDELVLAAATNGFAEVIVTHNVRDFRPASKGFGKQVLTPGDMMKLRRSS